MKKNFSFQQISKISQQTMPQHIAIIMDGNRRWQKQKLLSLFTGHFHGAKTLSTIVEAAAELKVKILTVFAFSTENWKRSKAEVKVLLNLFDKVLKEKKELLAKNGVKFETIGDLSRCPKSLQETISNVKQATKDCKKIRLVVAFNYGARDEMCRALKKIITDVEKKDLTLKQIDEELISSYLDTSQWQDPDLVIRTSGENRLSNFMMWQNAYSEIYITDVLWPDFSAQHLYEAIVEYQSRKRRYGK